MINAQKYIDQIYGVNKERDSKKEHSYYLKIIQQLLIEKDNQKKIYESKIKEGGYE